MTPSAIIFFIAVIPTTAVFPIKWSCFFVNSLALLEISKLSYLFVKLKRTRVLEVTFLNSESTLENTLITSLKDNPEKFPNTETAQKRNLSLPIYPLLQDSEADYIAKKLLEVLSNQE